MSVFLYSCSEDEFIRDAQQSPIAEVEGFNPIILLGHNFKTRTR